MPLKDLDRPAVPLSGGYAWFAESAPGAMVRLFAEGAAVAALGCDFAAARSRLVEIASGKLDRFRQEADHTIIITPADVSPPA